MSLKSLSKITPHLGDSSGFTLLEMMIVMAIMVFITFSIYQATTETFKLRDSLQKEGDFNNGIRLAMNIMQRDVTMLYSPSIMTPPSPSPSPVATTPGQPPQPQTPQPDLAAQLGDSAQTTLFWEGATDKTGLRLSRFTGTEDKIMFISASHVRVYKEAPESEFAKITYQLSKDTGTDIIPDTQVLTKIENTNAFDPADDTGFSSKGGIFDHVYPLLHGVKKLSFRYFQKPTDNSEGWKISTTWDTDKEETKNLYPDVIEVTLDVIGVQKLSYHGLYEFRPEIPFRGINPSF